MRRQVDPAEGTPPGSPQTQSATPVSSGISKSFQQHSFPLTPAQTPSPPRPCASANVSGVAHDRYSEASAKSKRHESSSVDDDPFVSSADHQSDPDVGQGQASSIASDTEDGHSDGHSDEQEQAPSVASDTDDGHSDGQEQAPSVASDTEDGPSDVTSDTEDGSSDGQDQESPVASDVEDVDSSSENQNSGQELILYDRKTDRDEKSTLGSHLTDDGPHSSKQGDQQLILRAGDEDLRLCGPVRGRLPYPPYRDRSFQDAIQIGIGIASDIASVLERCPDNSASQRLLAEAQMLSHYSRSSERLVGIVGNSGHGKSSLINTLLDAEDLAMTAATGTAATAFVIEYRHSLSHHTAPYTIECVCPTSRELNEQLELLLEDYRRPAFEDIQKLSGRDYEALLTLTEAAEAIFEAAFGDMEDFDFAKLDYDDTNITKESAVSHLSRWAARLDWPREMVDGKWTATAESAEQCQKLTTVFHERGLWPFIKNMRVYLQSSLLCDGLVLADLPGYHDVNVARVMAARQYQAQCDDIFVVAEIKRATDNPIVQGVIRECKSASADVGNVNHSNVVVVCTHSADLSDKRKLERLVDPTRLRRAKRKIQKHDAKGPATREDHQKVDHELNALLIEARNRKVTQDLQNRYATDFAPEQLPVFCVDNCMYAERSFPAMADTSGIPQLRRYAADLPMQALFKGADIFLAARIPALIGSFETWLEANRGSEVRTTRIELPKTEHLEKAMDEVVEWVEEMFHNIETTIEKRLNRRADLITRQALEVSRSWQAMHHASYAAFVRNNGTYETRAVGFKCWNSELAACFTDATAEKWREFDDTATRKFESLKRKVLKRLKHYRKQCSEASAPPALIQSLEGRETFMHNVFEDMQQDFLRGLRRIKHNATSGRATSYVLEYMMPAYRRAACDSGTGVNARRHRVINTHIRSEKFVDFHRDHVHEHFETLVEEIAAGLQEMVYDTIGSIQEDVDNLQGALNMEEEPLFVRDPSYGQEVEDVLLTAHAEMSQIERLAKTAREDAKVRYA